jgi:hypothetical protein
MNIKHIIALALILFCSLSAAEPHPMPGFFPSAPDKDKPIADYTPADVLGCVGTRELPQGHVFVAQKYTAGLKANWPGAKEATQVDAMLQIVLDAPKHIDLRELESGFQNVRYIMRKVMDIGDSTKSEALVRVVTAQTDPLKKARAKTFAASMFEDLLGPRLLAFEKDRLDDATVIGDMVSEGPSERVHHIVTARASSRNIILRHLERTLGMTVDDASFRIEDEAAGCAAFKIWLTEHWTEISTKCIEKAAAPNRELPTIYSAQWDARP